ncbi:LytR/AlgR family response regulator transcription factor [Zhouia sp. PK063]|uniref:LytR/AlgR family response regulator transcription factor n=1 Tax=Zhouia sp. PK063 TaxID=3373602 RepID=UPI003796B93A
MLKKLQHFLNQPYPFYYHSKTFWFSAIAISFGVFLLLYSSDPFTVNLSEQRISYAFTCLVHALVVGIIYFSFFSVVRTFKNNVVWTVKQEIISIIILFIIIGVGEFLVRDFVYIKPDNWSVYYLLTEVKNTFVLGILFSFIIIPINYNRLYRKHFKVAEVLNNHLNPKMATPSLENIAIKTQLKSDDFEIDPKKIIYITSDKNYLEIYVDREDTVQQLLKRITLKSMLAQLHKTNYLLQTHRSFVVNTHYINNISGNAQGYQLELNLVAMQIPVSRSFITNFNSQLQQTTTKA